MGECFFWYRPTRVVLDVCVCMCCIRNNGYNRRHVRVAYLCLADGQFALFVSHFGLNFRNLLVFLRILRFLGYGSWLLFRWFLGDFQLWALSPLGLNCLLLSLLLYTERTDVTESTSNANRWRWWMWAVVTYWQTQPKLVGLV